MTRTVCSWVGGVSSQSVLHPTGYKIPPHKDSGAPNIGEIRTKRMTHFESGRTVGITLAESPSAPLR